MKSLYHFDILLKVTINYKKNDKTIRKKEKNAIKVKTQYVQISNVIDTYKYPISHQSTLIVKVVWTYT